jgi:hypothetical protein
MPSFAPPETAPSAKVPVESEVKKAYPNATDIKVVGNKVTWKVNGKSWEAPLAK